MNSFLATLELEQQPSIQITDSKRCLVWESALMCLRSSPYRSVRELSCEFNAGLLILDGQVPSYHMKQVAQETIRRVVGVELIANRVIVENSDR